ncbi:hypothetical protein E2C01_083651 [Portunus trituberculatus]|uniref:Uncharacterized protein n=1 Tax=Portunus trituberculatus TaxID=210409 RepID=A0A5B7IXR1_PORTR|nr:hypothetical protein [Portunus trituberculatus]
MTSIKILHNDVFHAFAGLNPRKAYGPDGIPPIVLKTCPSELALCLAKLLQLCCYGPLVTYSTSLTTSTCYLVRHLSTSPSTSPSHEPSTSPSHEPSMSPSHEAPLLSRSWIHAAPFDSSGSVKRAP